MRYHLVRIAMIKKTRGREKGILVKCWQKCKLEYPSWKTAWIFLKKLQIELPYDASIMFIYSQHAHIHINQCVEELFTLPCSLQHNSQ
jgi:hypothetical protein